ncbi:hypothetical protein FIBSPDRAFT_1051243, partial [Athelia psychrophila]
MDSDEHCEYTLRVGAAEWTRDPKDHDDDDDDDDDDDMYVEVSVDGTRQVLRTMYTKAAYWDEDLHITGSLSSIVRIDIKSVAYNSSERFSIARTDTSLGDLLKTCADGDAAALELTIAPLMPDMREQVTVSDVGNGLRDLTTGSMGIITVNLSRPTHNPPSLPQISNIYAEPTPQTDDPEEVVTAVEVAPHPQGSNVGSLVASIQESGQSGTENLVATKAVIDPDELSNFLLFVGTAEWTRDQGAREDNYDLFVEVKVVGSREAHRTMSKETPCWNENIKITGYLSSIVRIEIRSVAHNSSESLSVVRVEISLQNLLEKCADSDAAFLGLAIAPLVSGVVCPVVGTGGHMNSKHLAPNSIGRMTVKLRWLSHAPAQLPDTSTVSVPQMSQLERRIPEDVEEDLKIENLEQTLALSSYGDPKMPALLNNIGVGYIKRFRRLGDLADLENSIVRFEQALALTLDGHADKPSRLSNLGSGHLTRFERLGDLADLENSIASHQQAVALTPDGHPDKPYQQAVALTPDGHPDKPGRLTNLGNGRLRRFERLGDLADVENSIASYQQAVALTPDGHPDKPGCLANLGNGRLTRFERLGDLVDVENSIVSYQQAVALTPDGHPDKPGRLTNLGNGYGRRFERLGDLADVENSVVSYQQAVALTPDGHPDRPGRLTNFGHG